jgi:uncharacterized protein
MAGSAVLFVDRHSLKGCSLPADGMMQTLHPRPVIARPSGIRSERLTAPARATTIRSGVMKGWFAMSAERDRVIAHLRASRADLQARGIRRLALFGSLARGDGRADSDVDVAVEIEPGRSFSLIRMEETRLMLEARLGRRVDLGEIEAFRPSVRAAFERDHLDVF